MKETRRWEWAATVKDLGATVKRSVALIADKPFEAEHVEAGVFATAQLKAH